MAVLDIIIMFNYSMAVLSADQKKAHQVKLYNFFQGGMYAYRLDSILSKSIHYFIALK